MLKLFIRIPLFVLVTAVLLLSFVVEVLIWCVAWGLPLMLMGVAGVFEALQWKGPCKAMLKVTIAFAKATDGLVTRRPGTARVGTPRLHAMRVLSNCYLREKDFQNLIAIDKEAMELLIEAGELGHAGARAANIGVDYMLIGDLDSAFLMTERGLTYLKSAMQKSNAERAERAAQKEADAAAAAASAEGNTDTAKPVSTASPSSSEEPFKKNSEEYETALNRLINVEYANALFGRAWVFEVQRRFDEALPLRRESVELLERELGPDNVDITPHLNQYGALLARLGDFANAEPAIKRCNQLRAENKSPEEQLCSGLQTLGDLYCRMGDYAQAKGPMEDACARARKAKMDCAEFLDSLARLRIGERRFEDARSILEESISEWRRQFGDLHPMMLDAFEMYADVLEETHQDALAKDARAKIAEICTKWKIADTLPAVSNGASPATPASEPESEREPETPTPVPVSTVS